MDEFTPCGNYFQKALSNLCKFIKKYIEMNLSLSPRKCEFLMNAGIVLGHFLPKGWIQVDPGKVAIIKRVHVP